MERFLGSIRKSIENQNWYGALFIALSLPDICGRVEYPEKASSTRYIDWYNKYLLSVYTHKMPPDQKDFTFLSGEDCYALRCSYIHEGRDNISHQQRQRVLNDFMFTTTESHCNYFETNGHKRLQLSVEKFCSDICSAVIKWSVDVSNNQAIQQRISELLTINPTINSSINLTMF